MFSSISWGQYFSAVALLLVFYYAYVAFHYYKWEILGVMGVKKIDSKSIAAPTMHEFRTTMDSSTDDSYLPNIDQALDFSPLVESFRDEVKAYLEEASPWIEKEELFDALKSIISKYPALKTTDYLPEISAKIFFEVNNAYPDFIIPNDLEHLWS